MRERTGLMLVIALSLLTFVPARRATAQETARTLEWRDHANINTGKVDLPWSRRIEEIELEDISIDGKSILIGEPFIGDFRRLIFRVKNVSHAPVGFIQITLTLPEMKHVIQIPFIRTAPDKKKPLLPGEETELRLPGDEGLYNWISKSASEQGSALANLRKVAIDIVFVTPDKGDQVTGGCVRTRDPRNECPPVPSRK